MPANAEYVHLVNEDDGLVDTIVIMEDNYVDFLDGCTWSPDDLRYILAIVEDREFEDAALAVDDYLDNVYGEDLND